MRGEPANCDLLNRAFFVYKKSHAFLPKILRNFAKQLRTDASSFRNPRCYEISRSVSKIYLSFSLREIRENIGRRFDTIPNRISALITEECVRLFFELTSRFQQTLLRLLRGNDAEMKGGRGDCDVRQQRQLVLAAFLKKGGPRALNASHYFDDLFRLAKHARAHPAIGLVKHSSSLSRCTRAHTPLAQPNLVITYRFRVVVSLSPRYRFSLCRSAADKAVSRNLPSIRPFVYVYIELSVQTLRPLFVQSESIRAWTPRGGGKKKVNNAETKERRKTVVDEARCTRECKL